MSPYNLLGDLMLCGVCSAEHDHGPATPPPLRPPRFAASACALDRSALGRAGVMVAGPNSAAFVWWGQIYGQEVGFARRQDRVIFPGLLRLGWRAGAVSAVDASPTSFDRRRVLMACPSPRSLVAQVTVWSADMGITWVSCPPLIFVDDLPDFFGLVGSCCDFADEDRAGRVGRCPDFLLCNRCEYSAAEISSALLARSDRKALFGVLPWIHLALIIFALARMRVVATATREDPLYLCARTSFQIAAGHELGRKRD